MAENTLYLIDFDRTLVDVDRFMDLAEEVCGAIGVDFAPIAEARAEAWKKSVSYSPLKDIDKAGEGMQARFKEKFLETADPRVLIYPDGQRFLDRLNQVNRHYIVLTYAVDEHWQKLKLEASGLDKVPHIITSAPEKGKDLKEWMDKDGKFVPPLADAEPFDYIIFIDDRLSVFADMPENCEGLHLDRRQGGNNGAALLPHVTQINSLDDIIAEV